MSKDCFSLFPKLSQPRAPVTRIPSGGERAIAFFCPGMEFLFFTASFPRQKKASLNTTWLAKKKEACLHERGNFFFANSRGCARDARGTQGRIGSFRFFCASACLHKRGKKPKIATGLTDRRFGFFFFKVLCSGKKDKATADP